MKLLAIFQGKPQFAEFALAELKSLINLYSKETDLNNVFQYEQNFDSSIYQQNQYQITKDKFQHFPLVFLNLPSLEIADQILQRSMMVKCFLQVISHGKNYEEIIQNVDQNILQQYNNEQKTIAIKVKAVNKKLSQENKNEKIKFLLKELDLKCKINLENPDQIFKVYENHNIISKDQLIKECDIIYIGKQILKNKKGMKYINKNFKINDRIYVGPTSADPYLAFLMANQAKVQQNQFVLDLFCGTGGLLIPCAVFNAICFGSDIDYRVLQGTKVGRLNKNSSYYQSNTDITKANVFTNFDQYQLLRPNLLQFDVSVNTFKHQFLFDAIVCDPPYGIRAGVKQSGLKNHDNIQQQIQQINMAKENEDAQYYPSTKNCEVNELVESLFNIAQNLLKSQGMLVFLYPWIFELASTIEDVIKLMPVNQYFKLVDVTENNLNNCKRSRLLFTYQKI